MCSVALYQYAGVFPLHAMTNHSCDPNCEFTAGEGGKYIREFAKRAIKKGEELTISYLHDTSAKPVHERREYLLLVLQTKV